MYFAVTIENMKSEKEYTEGISLKENKFLGWWDNFWYYHKWHTLIAVFIILVLGICIFQMCTKVDYDMMFTYAGPKEFATATGAQEKININSTLSNAITDQYGEEASANLLNYVIHSKEQIEALAEEKDENGKPLYNMAEVSAQATRNLNEFNQFCTLGDSYIFFLDPYIYDQMQDQVNDGTERFVPLADVLEKKPACAYDDYAVRLIDTDFYKNNPSLHVLPEDTLVCLHQRLAFADKNYYNCYFDTFKKIAAVSVSE